MKTIDRIWEHLEENKYRLRHLLGIDAILHQQRLIEDIYIPAAVKHPDVFTKYKGINRGKNVVIVGSGPTLKYYHPIKDAVHMGINNAVFREDICFNYYMVVDFDGCNNMFQKIFSVDYPMRVFFGIVNSDRRGQLIPECYRNRDNVEVFYAYGMRGTDDARYEKNHSYSAPVDLTVSPLHAYGTTLHLLMEFALWTHPDKIYLVGADCFGTEKLIVAEDEIIVNKVDYRIFIQGWKYLKEFSDENYPDIEIISVNPIGLAHVFHDLYTEEFKKAEWR